jgi:hypothetical protein
MSKPKSPEDKTYPLDILKRLLETPQLLPHENSQEFLQLFDRLEDYGKPENPRDYLVVYQATVLTWEILRYQRLKVGVLRSHQRPALESLLRKSHVHAATKGGGERFVQVEAHKDATKWFADPASRPALMNAIEKAGYPADALEVEAFQLALPTLAPIERLIVSAQKRLDLFLEDLERSAEARALAIRLAAEKAIAEHDAAVSSTSRE